MHYLYIFSCPLLLDFFDGKQVNEKRNHVVNSVLSAACTVTDAFQYV